MAHDSFHYAFPNDKNLAVIMMLQNYALFKHPRKILCTSKILPADNNACLLPNTEERN